LAWMKQQARLRGCAICGSLAVKMPDGSKAALLDLGSWDFTHSKYMLGVYSHLIVLVVGYLASFLFPSDKADAIRAAIPTSVYYSTINRFYKIANDD